MKNLTSFVKSLQGTTPASPKDPQGEPWSEVVASSGADSSSSTKPAQQ